MAETTLTIAGVELPVGSARGVSADWQPIRAGELRRTINGDAAWLGRATHRKWRLSLQASDMSTPTLGELWPGDEVAVGWPGYLRVPGGASVTLPRDPVAGSVRGIDADGLHVAPSSVAGREVSFAAAPMAVEFRPSMTMVVVSHTANAAEWEAAEGWKLELEEV